MPGLNPVAAGGLIGTGLGAATGNPLLAQIGGSAGGLIGSMFGDNGISDEALNLLKQAQARILAIPNPTAEDMKLVLQPLMQKGLITPEQYKTISLQPTAFAQMNLDQTGRNAEIAALNQLQDISKQGGNDAQFRAAMNEARNASGTQARGAREAILQNAAERGALNSNLTAASQLSQASQDAYNLNSAQTQAAADAEARALSAIASSANVGSNLSAQDYKQAADKAAAIDAINAYNAKNSQGQSNLNTETANAAQQGNLQLATNIAQYNNQNQNEAAKWNAALPQQVFQNKLSQAGAAAGVALPTANLIQQGQQNTNALQGNLVGNIGQAVGNYYSNPNIVSAQKQPTATTASYQPQVEPAYNPMKPITLAGGGEVPGQAPYPGDNPANDTVPARLSPGEVVVPRSAASNPLKLADFVASVSRGKPSLHPEDVKNVLEAMTRYRQSGPPISIAAPRG